MLDLAGGCVLGALLGVRHALEPDHLAAVSTLVATESEPLKGALIGALWGVGHAAALLFVWALLWVLQAELPARVTNLLEVGVALMLIGLGARALLRAIRPTPSSASMGGPPARRSVSMNRPIGAGFLHGAAGSGALTALVMAGLPSPALRLAYVLLFGLGSLLGMALLTGLFALPLARIQGSQAAGRGIPALTGLLAIGLGLQWVYAPLLSLLA